MNVGEQLNSFEGTSRNENLACTAAHSSIADIEGQSQPNRGEPERCLLYTSPSPRD